MVAALAASWLLVAIPVAGWFTIPAALHVSHPAGSCVELCVDWADDFISGGFAYVFALSVVTTAIVASALAVDMARHGDPVWMLSSAGSVAVLGSAWALGVTLGAPAQGLEIVAGALAAAACTAHLLATVLYRRLAPLRARRRRIR